MCKCVCLYYCMYKEELKGFTYRTAHRIELSANGNEIIND